MAKSYWWVNLPGITAIALMIAITAHHEPWPARAPVHFDFHWQANRWGSPWVCAFFPLLAAMILIAQIIASALWARHDEAHERFNFTLPLMAAALGAIAGIHFWYWTNLSQLAATGHAGHPWEWLWLSTLAIAGTTAILESARKRQTSTRAAAAQ
jgi:hypothetical protein